MSFKSFMIEHDKGNQSVVQMSLSTVFQVTDLDDEAGSPIEEFKAFTGDSCMNRSQSEYCNVGSKTSLTNHPAKKYVFDFMRVLIMDNLCMTPASKQTPIVDLLLEVNGLSDERTFDIIIAIFLNLISMLMCI